MNQPGVKTIGQVYDLIQAANKKAYQISCKRFFVCSFPAYLKTKQNKFIQDRSYIVSRSHDMHISRSCIGLNECLEIVTTC